MKLASEWRVEMTVTDERPIVAIKAGYCVMHAVPLASRDPPVFSRLATFCQIMEITAIGRNVICRRNDFYFAGQPRSAIGGSNPSLKDIRSSSWRLTGKGADSRRRTPLIGQQG
jgi:hypothetical protein